ncbi:MAG: alanine--tRNA ligase [Bacteroidota bacterium]
MESKIIREKFLEFFKSKEHEIVSSAPMVLKNDPTLMFTNAGMNQFKDLFLGNSTIKFPRIADTQKCLRVSGKHNDLEEVGHDTYHHTMFEMLGNWSFGNYFKKEAIDWAWELLTEVYKIDENIIYATYFGGDPAECLAPDIEAFDLWKQYLPEERILPGSKKDNFWEMGDQGPCGPCSEIHVDLRDEADKKLISGRELVNESHHLVIEIWNLVFIQFNRKADSSLEQLPNKHVDTGMGFERLCMVLQHKKSNYDTDVFQPLLMKIASLSNLSYGKDEKKDIAMRVIADHVRAVSFAIADGQLPSNTGAGYVIRRILRRAIRYGFSFLDMKSAFICNLVQVLSEQMGSQFPEIRSQKQLVERVIREEEESFLNTLDKGIAKFENYIKVNTNKLIDGQFAFELYDTYGFPIDLTELLAKEKGFEVDMTEFLKSLEAQKERSRKATKVETDDWQELFTAQTEFVGYDNLMCEAKIVKYRKVKSQNKELFQLVLDITPFYAESGGQAGDKGWLINGDDKVAILNTIKENNLTIHITEALPIAFDSVLTAKVDENKRRLTENNHSATHLIHAALKKVLGTHVEQKGSLVNDERLRFDFSHFSKLSDSEIAEIEMIVNTKIRENIKLEENRNMPIAEAQKLGAMALFGEKYGDSVRVITFDKNYSIELCGGTHASATGNIGMVKIISESAIAAGIRRIEAITSDTAEAFINCEIEALNNIRQLFKNNQNVFKNVSDLIDENAKLNKLVEEFNKEKAKIIKSELANKFEMINGFRFIATKLDADASTIKDIAFQLKSQFNDLFLIIGSESNGKANIAVALSDDIVKKGLNASAIIRELSKEINGGGGGQPFFATAGGTNIAGIDNTIEKAKAFLK